MNKKDKKNCSGHKKNVSIGLAALFIFLLLSLYSQIQMDPTITGAVVLKNKCEITPSVYVVLGSNDNYVYALDGATGCVVWKADASADIKTTPTIKGGTIFVGNAESKFYALSLVDGSKIWTADTSKIYGAAVSDGTTVYIADNAGALSAYPVESSTASWTYTAKNIKADLKLDNNILYFVDTFLKVGSVVALDTATQKQKWKFSATSEISAAPLVTSDAIYVPSNENTLYRLNKQAGVAVWKFSAAKSIRSTPIIDSEGILYFGSNDGYFYAVNSKDGKLVWKYQANEAITATATADNKNVYFGAQNNQVYAVNKKTGALVWSIKTNGKIYGSLAMYKDMLFVPSGDYSVYALNSANGQKIWSYATKGALYGGIVVEG